MTFSSDMMSLCPKAESEAEKLPAKNPTDPMKLARSVVEAAIGEPLASAKPKKKDRFLVVKLISRSTDSRARPSSGHAGSSPVTERPPHNPYG